MVMMVRKPPFDGPIGGPIAFPPRPITLPNTADQANFQMLDGDGNGKVSRDEWIRAGWTADRFAAFDANGDGNISQEEFMQGRRYEREFNAKDWNGDGSLSRTELTGLQLMYAKAQDGLASLAGGAANIVRPFWPGLADKFSRYDADGDGKVSKQEYFEARRKEESRQIDPIIRPMPIFNPRDIMLDAQVGKAAANA